MQKKKLLIGNRSYLCLAVCQAAVIRVLTTISTGMTSIIRVSSHMILLSVPLPISTIIPDIPDTLSTQPGTGSFHDPVTKNGKENVNSCFYPKKII